MSCATSSHPERKWAFPALIVAAISVLMAAGLAFFAMPERASANGGARLVVNDVEAGPYIFRVGILPGSPKVGILHVSILVQDAEGDIPVNGATVTMTATGPAGIAVTEPVVAANSAQNPQLYEGNINLDALGSWTMTIRTESGLGSAALDVPLQVTEPDGFNLLYIVIGVVAVIALGSLAWSQAKRGRGRSAR